MAERLIIKIRQLELGITNREIARAYGCSEQFVGQVINGHRTSKKLQAYIARRLGRVVQELFPQDRTSQAA